MGVLGGEAPEPHRSTSRGVPRPALAAVLGEVSRVCTGHRLLLWELSQGLSQLQAVLPALETPKIQHSSDVFVPQTVKNSIIAHCFPCSLGITDTRHRNLV